MRGARSGAYTFCEPHSGELCKGTGEREPATASPGGGNPWVTTPEGAHAASAARAALAARAARAARSAQRATSEAAQRRIWVDNTAKPVYASCKPHSGELC